MKKLLLSMSLMLVAFALTNCTKDAAEDKVLTADGNGFSFTANIDGADTKASFDGLKTAWESGDQVALGGITASSTYTTARLYGFDYTSDNKFSNDTSSFSEANQFYALFPTSLASSKYTEVYTANYESTDATLVHRTKSYFNVGYDGTNKTAIVQSGTGASHVPAYAPMYWMSDGAVDAEGLTVQFHHTTTLMKFTVVNGTDAALTVKNVKISTPSDVKICGTYYINLSTGELTASGTNYVYSSATVEVSDAPELAAGESFDVYLPLAPFSLEANDVVTVVVTSTDGATCTVEKTLSSALSFEAGKVNTATVNFVADAVAEEPITVSELATEIAAGKTSFSGVKVKGIVSAFAKDSNQNLSFGTLILTDNTGEKGSAVKFYTSTNGLVSADELAVGDELIINLANATIVARGGVNQIQGVLAADIVDVPSYGNEIVATEVSVADYLADATAYDNLYLKFVDVKPVASYVGLKANTTLLFTDGTNEFTVYNRSAWTEGAAITIADLTGTLYAFAQYYNAAQVCPTSAKDLEAFADPCILSSEKVTFTAEGGTETVTATLADGYSLGAAQSDTDWLTVIPATDGTILLQATEYTSTTEPRTATISVDVAKDGATVLTKTITVTQKAAGSAVEATVTFDFTAMDLANQEVVSSKTVDDITITFDKGSGSNAPAYYTSGTSIRTYPKNTIQVSGGTVSNIVFTYSQNKAASGVCSLTATAGGFDIEDWSTATSAVPSGIATWTGDADDVTFTVASTNNGGLRISKIVVTYTK